MNTLGLIPLALMLVVVVALIYYLRSLKPERITAHHYALSVLAIIIFGFSGLRVGVLIGEYFHSMIATAGIGFAVGLLGYCAQSAVDRRMAAASYSEPGEARDTPLRYKLFGALLIAAAGSYVVARSASDGLPNYGGAFVGGAWLALIPFIFRQERASTGSARPVFQEWRE